MFLSFDWCWRCLVSINWYLLSALLYSLRPSSPQPDLPYSEIASWNFNLAWCTVKGSSSIVSKYSSRLAYKQSSTWMYVTLGVWYLSFSISLKSFWLMYSGGSLFVRDVASGRRDLRCRLRKRHKQVSDMVMLRFDMICEYAGWRRDIWKFCCQSMTIRIVEIGKWIHSSSSHEAPRYRITQWFPKLMFRAPSMLLRDN